MSLTMTVRRVVAVAAALASLTIAFVAGTGSSATANTGDPMVAGAVNNATKTTFLINQSTDAADGKYGFEVGVFSDAGIGVLGSGGSSGAGACGLTANVAIPCDSFPGTGVFGGGVGNGVSGLTANGLASGVYGQNTAGGYGMKGLSASGVGIFGQSLGAADGVDGQTNSSCCSAVYGLNNGGGNGVAGRADTGTGVLAASTSGIGLKVDGKTQFSRSGVATVSVGQTYKQVTLTGPTSATFVVATVQGGTGGVWVQRVAVTPASSSFRIYLNKAATATTKVGWFAIG
jgi:hypothetical protein